MGVKETFDSYVDGVLSGAIPTGKLTRLSCERHLRDRQNAETKGWCFDWDAAERIVNFFPHLNHSRGFTGEFVLSPWQVFIFGSIFGWKWKSTGSRRYSTAYIEIPRKNGKTTTGAGLGLYCLAFDGEPGAECFVVAAKQEQAMKTFDEARNMVNGTEALADLLQINWRAISYGINTFKPMSSKTHTLHGLNPSLAIIDELHAHVGQHSKLWSVMESGMGARKQPILFAITTAGVGQQSVCWQKHEFARKMLEGAYNADQFFAYICGPDEGDDWRDERTWYKTNPNLGVSVSIENMRKECEEAKHDPAKEMEFRQLRLNEWLAVHGAWLNQEHWRACIKTDVKPKGPCFGGLDLSLGNDFTAFTLVYPEAGNLVVPYFWLPEDVIPEKMAADGLPYSDWVRSGLIRTTPGSAIDFDQVRQDILEICAGQAVREIGYDERYCVQLAQQLEAEGYTLVMISPSFGSISPPSKELARLLANGGIALPDNAVLNWMASNVVVERDSLGNIRPTKSKSSGKIDGVVAIICALARSIYYKPKPKPSLCVL